MIVIPGIYFLYRVALLVLSIYLSTYIYIYILLHKLIICMNGCCTSLFHECVTDVATVRGLEWIPLEVIAPAHDESLLVVNDLLSINF